MKTKTFVLALMLAVPMFAGADNKTTDKTTDKAKNDKPAKLSEADIKIISHLHHVNLMEVDMGKMAQKQGTAPVKKYGEMLVRDHSTADKELVTFAKKRGIATIAHPKPTSDAEKAEVKTQVDAMASLKKLKGADFDREFLRMMVVGHDKELAMTDPSIAISTDEGLRQILEARKTTLTRHSEAAKELQKGNAQASTGPTPPSK